MPPPPWLISRLLVCIAAALLAAGCFPDPGPVPDDLRGGTFEGEIPKDLETLLLFDGQVLRVDASGNRVFFPMPRSPREFGRNADFFDFIATRLGAELVIDDQAGVVGVRGRYTQVGNSFFFDPVLDLFYLVEDPISAYLGGLDGRVIVADQEICLDLDGACDDGIASYLLPGGILTRPTQETNCNGDRSVCARGTSFFNTAPWVPPLFAWARHGTNEAMTTGSAIGETIITPRTCDPGEPFDFDMELCFPTLECAPAPPVSCSWGRECARWQFCYDALGATRLTVSGRVVDWVEDLGMADIRTLERLEATGETSLETAIWCLVTTGADCFELRATAVCGTGFVSDTRIAPPRTHLTGNGPDNTMFCGP